MCVFPYLRDVRNKYLGRWLMVSLTTGNVTYIVSVSACGRCTAATCLILILAFLMSPLELFNTFVFLYFHLLIWVNSQRFSYIDWFCFEQNLRPEIPRCCPSSLARIMRRCWDGNPDKRPDMDEVVRLLEAMDTSKGGGMIPEDQSTGFWCFCVGRGP